MGEVRPDAVVHLAGIPGERTLAESLTSHAVSTAALLEAMVRHDVPRIVYASSNHAVGRTARAEDGLGVDVAPRPDTFYGVGKVAARRCCSSTSTGTASTPWPPGSARSCPSPPRRRHLSTWLSPDDAVRMFEATVTTEAKGYAVIYGISANTRAWWDLEPGRALGYHPEDDAEAWAVDIETLPRTPGGRRRGHLRRRTLRHLAPRAAGLRRDPRRGLDFESARRVTLAA